MKITVLVHVTRLNSFHIVDFDCKCLNPPPPKKKTSDKEKLIIIYNVGKFDSKLVSFKGICV